MKRIITTPNKLGLYVLVVSLSVASLLLVGCANLPNDGTNAKLAHLRNIHETRYCEIFVVGGNVLAGDLKANVYNTTGYNNTGNVKDTAPEALLAKLDMNAIKKQYHALGAALNGPKLWQLDWINVPSGTVRDFNGLKAPWVAELNLKGVNMKDKSKMSYRPVTIARKSAFGYNKGTRVFLMDDPEGNTWIMKGMELGLGSKKTYQSIVGSIDTDRKLPPGWKGRSKVLDKDLILIPKTGIATITSDSLFNVYDKTGPGYSNYKP